MTAPCEKKMPGPSIHTTVSGHVTLAVGKEDGSSHEVRADFPNMVLDSGLELYAEGTFVESLSTYAHVGSSGAAVNAAQTVLLAPLGSSTSSAETYEVVSVDPFTVEHTSKYRFREGVAQGNVAEIGFGDRSSVYDPLFSRALVLDEFGSPSAVTVLADEYLDVSYVLTFTTDIADVPFTMNLSTGSVSGVLRPSQLEALGSTSRDALGAFAAEPDDLYDVSNGTLGPITGYPTGDTESSDAGVRAQATPYVPGTLYRDFEYKLDVQHGNLPSGGFSTARTRSSLTKRPFQMSFDPPVPKTAERVFTFGIRISVGRG